MLNPIASSVLVGFYLFAGVFLIVVLAALTFALFKLNALIEMQRASIETTLANANRAMMVATEKIDLIGGKVEVVLTQGEQIAETVHEKVEQTAGAVQRTVNAPIIGLNSIAAGFSRGMKTFASLQSQDVGIESESKNDQIAIPVAASTAHRK